MNYNKMTPKQRQQRAREMLLEIEQDMRLHNEEMATRQRDAKAHGVCMYNHASAYNRQIVKSCANCGLEMCTFCGWGYNGKYYCNECWDLL